LAEAVEAGVDIYAFSTRFADGELFIAAEQLPVEI
jgi:hypothetical protein